MSETSGTPLAGCLVALRTLSEADYRTLYAWRSDPEWLYLWSQPRRLVSYSEFATTLDKSLRAEVDIWLLMVSAASQEPVGFVYSYDTNAWDGHTFICLYVTANGRGQGLGREGGALFVRYLMTYFPYRKIYADVFEFNRVSHMFVSEYGFVEEGVFPSHRYYDGKNWTLRRLALYRDKWDQLCPHLFSGADVQTRANLRTVAEVPISDKKL